MVTTQPGPVEDLELATEIECQLRNIRTAVAQVARQSNLFAEDSMVNRDLLTAVRLLEMSCAVLKRRATQ